MLEWDSKSKRGFIMFRKQIPAVFMYIVICGTLFCVTGLASAESISIIDVNIIPAEPLADEVITISVLGRAANSGSWVEYSEFSMVDTSLQLDLHIDMGITFMPSIWSYSQDISPLPAETYSLTVCGFEYYSGTLEDTYVMDFTVVPEPATIWLLAAGMLAVRATKRSKSRQYK